MWIVIKIVLNTGRPEMLGAIVGPFATEELARNYADAALVGSLGYEKWIVKQLERP